MIVNLLTRDRGNVMIVSVNGSLTRNEHYSALCEKIWELVQGGGKWILVDMAGITSIDCFGMGDLVVAFTTVSNAGGEMKLLNVNSRIRRVLQLVRLDSVFEMHDDESIAALSFLSHQATARFEYPSEVYFG